MQSWRLRFAAVLLLAGTLLALPGLALAQDGDPPDAPALSPYWKRAVSRWEPIILHYAEQRDLDPNLVAAVIWKESLGRPTAHGPAGAVGLMMVMPFAWRPSPEELENPWTNLHWGARALAHTIDDGNGDLYYSLAAYNGSWEKIESQNTRRYAASVLDHYTRSVAAQHGLPPDGDWLAILAIEGAPPPGTITVLGPQRPLARYTQRRWLQADIPTVPDDVLPHVTAAAFVNEQGAACRVNVWLVAEDGSSLLPSAAQPPLSSHRPLAAEKACDVREGGFAACP